MWSVILQLWASYIDKENRALLSFLYGENVVYEL